MTVSMILLTMALLLFVGMLIGYTLTTQAFQARTKRQAAMQHSLNSQWQELESQWQELESRRQMLNISRQTIPQHGKGELSTQPSMMNGQCINNSTISRSPQGRYIGV